MWITITIIAVIAILAIYKYYTRLQKLEHVPGPPTFPVIGNLHQLSPQKMTYVLADMAQQYGPVMKIRMLNEDVLIICSKEAAMEALAKSDDFAGRPTSFILNAAMWGGGDIVGGDYNERWRLSRKIAFKVLHMHGDGVQRIQSVVQEELERLIDVLNKTESKAFDPADVVFDAIINMMLILLMGDRLDNGSNILKHWREYINLLNPAFDLTGGFQLDFLPWLRHLPLPSVRFTLESIKKANKKRDFLMDEFFKDSKWGTVDENKIGIVNDLFKEQAAYGRDVYTDDMIRKTVLNLILAGTGSSSHTLYAFLLLITVHSECQQRMADELEEVVGTSRLPSLSDKEKLPYTQAVLREVLRYVTIAPSTLFHRAIRNTKVQGYHVPKDTKMLVNLWAVNHDPKYWKEPEKFNPENFLKDGVFNGYDTSFSYMSFGAGKRNCLGESFAKSRIFLICATVIQRFRLLPPEDGVLPGSAPRDWINGAINFTQPYKICFVPRI